MSADKLPETTLQDLVHLFDRVDSYDQQIHDLLVNTKLVQISYFVKRNCWLNLEGSGDPVPKTLAALIWVEGRRPRPTRCRTCLPAGRDPITSRPI